MCAERRGLALIALFAGATAIASSALFVKVSETGPVSTAFWRVFLALPLLWAWALAGGWPAHAANYRSQRWLMWAAGLFFVGDLAVWHWSIVLTSVANATLLANLAPIFVTLAAWLFFRHVPTGLFLTGLAFALAGMAFLIGGDFRLAGGALLGNVLGVITAMFYAGYQMVVTRLRAGVSTASIMAWASAITAVVLLPLALVSGEQFFPASSTGWIKLLGLALVSQVAGQSLIAYAMAHLPATLSSVALLLQPVIAALLAAVLLGEAMHALQVAGGIMMLAGIGIAHQGRHRL
jgi:drug/metabolite transporter (DMT)-like permease